MDLNLAGRTAVISGGSMGIGKAIASGLAAEGVNLVLLARGQEALDETASEIGGAHGVEILTVSTDIRDAESVNAMAAAAAEKFGTIHILVNSAGHRMRRFDRQLLWNDEDWIGDIDHKTVGMLRVVRALYPHLATDGSGRIINISGTAGLLVWEGALTHGINNSAMLHITRYLARDLAADKINVNAVVPGLVATEWRQGWAGMVSEKQGKSRDEFLADYTQEKGILAGRWASMEEIADPVVFLASDRAQYINGESLAVDAGQSINPR
jgi:NAD(P)-dependent dehydrogenase (short-subunit alcohol dehydrogenase family)